jgi:DNA-directed RNA polymerase specialized sigma24 family protein
MSGRSEPEAGRLDPSLSAVVSERRLMNLAYRLLGSLIDAEDVVQETYARWYAMSRQQQDAIESPGAWLTTVASRICLNLLGSARARRERYMGGWLPEPLPDGTEWISGRQGGIAPDPADRVTLEESVGMGFLVVLESMTPAERVAFFADDIPQARTQITADRGGQVPVRRPAPDLGGPRMRRPLDSSTRVARTVTVSLDLLPQTRGMIDQGLSL